MTWWAWALLGLGLCAGEMVTPGGFYFLFFGVGALVTSALVWLGIAGPPWLEWLVFTLVSVACLVPLRGRMVQWASAGDPRVVDSLVGEELLLLADLDPGGLGKGELRGTTWNVRTTAPRTLRQGERPRVTRVEGLTLWVEI